MTSFPTPMPPREVERLVALVAHLWPHATRHQPDEELELWSQLLAGIPLDTAIAVMRTVALSEAREFPPPIGVVVGKCHDALNPIPTADQAWTEVLGQMRSQGTYGTPEFSHPAVADVVRVFGWRELCLSESLEIDRAHFLRTYGDIRERHRWQRDMPDHAQQAIAATRAERAMGGEQGVAKALDAFVATTRPTVAQAAEAALDARDAERDAAIALPAPKADPRDTCGTCDRKGYLVHDDGPTRCPDCRPAP